MSVDIKCPTCQSGDGHEDGPMASTMVYYRAHVEDGIIHHHDGNKRTARYMCSNNHPFYHHTYSSCPTCGWKGGEDVVVPA